MEEDQDKNDGKPNTLNVFIITNSENKVSSFYSNNEFDISSHCY
jgi:hypothetical protein